MKRLLLLSLLVGGCATAPVSEPGPGPRRPVLSSTESGQYVELPSDSRPVEAEIATGAGAAWPRLIQVYRALDIPLATIQPTEMRLGNPNFTIRNRIGGLPAARVFDCGRGRGGALVAELYPIHISLHTRLLSTESGGTRVESVLIGVAQDAGGNSTNPIRCSSMGALERRIVERLQEAGTP